jgi:signal transduction histidine kinase
MFLAILSHDLRNPLASIGMTAHMVPLVCKNPAEAIACGQQISNDVLAMERMIGDLLDYTRTRLGAGMPVKPAPLDLGGLAKNLFEQFRTAHPNRDIQLHTDGDMNGRWDCDRLRQAISNLLGNAIQHGSADFPVTLSIRGEASEIFIDVHNGGDPIPPGELQIIFDPLIRGSSAQHPTRNRPGSIGLGLYIAREVAKSHGGRIDVSSTAKDGTSFIVRLPRDVALTNGQPILDAEHIEMM